MKITNAAKEFLQEQMKDHNIKTVRVVMAGMG